MEKANASRLKAEIAKRIAELLSTKGWQADQLASELGTSKAHINRLLAGKVNVTIETIGRLESIFERPVIKVQNKTDDFNDERGKALMREVKKRS